MKVLILVASLFSLPALAGADHLALQVGQTRNLMVGEKIATVEVSNSEVLEVRRSGAGQVMVAARKPGQAKLHLVTAGKAEVELLVLVTSGGSVEYIRLR
jgi:hypothetical protein